MRKFRKEYMLKLPAHELRKLHAQMQYDLEYLEQERRRARENLELVRDALRVKGVIIGG
jgi:hypothetical protein